MAVQKLNISSKLIAYPVEQELFKSLKRNIDQSIIQFVLVNFNSDYTLFQVNLNLKSNKFELKKIKLYPLSCTVILLMIFQNKINVTESYGVFYMVQGTRDIYQQKIFLQPQNNLLTNICKVHSYESHVVLYLIWQFTEMEN